MCKTCEQWGFKDWEFVQTKGQRIRVQCPVCKRFYCYLTMSEFYESYPGEKLKNETSHSDNSDFSRR